MSMTIGSAAGLVVGSVFVGLACCNAVLMLEVGRTQNVGMKRRLVSLHRLGGYAFVVLYCTMAYAMSQRLAGEGLSKLPTHIVVHVALALGLTPLLLLKVSIARRYKHAQFLLMPLGLAILIIAAVLVALPAVSELLRPADPDGLGFKVIGVLVIALSVLLCGSAVRSTIKRPLRVSISARGLSPSAPASRSTHTNASVPMTLRLVEIVPETHDTKTLRFVVPRERRLQARPGQFLTFRWMIDGRRVLRSYTISSSPVHLEHVEITPKRLENGCVSTFLHDRAKTGLTVEATGPYGRFYFDERLHPSVALIAAGSGITPMMSMLRYIADRGLSTPATLLYCVRTRKDIIFETELERLTDRVPNFTYGVSLSQPDEAWTGRKGHLTREFILEHLTDLAASTFFLCGPPGFMDGARQLLTSFGVSESRITQESFGTKSTGWGAVQGEPVATIEFVRSHTACEFPAGSSLLDVAEKEGVAIPFGCRQGRCGTCATRVLSGAVRMDTDEGLTIDQKRAGYVLACVSRAAGDIVVQA